MVSKLTSAKWIRSRKLAMLAAKIALAALLMALLLKPVRLSEVLQTLRNPRHPHFFICGWILLLPNLYLQWLRWHFLLRRIQKDLSWRESIPSLLGGLSIGTVTPGRFGEIGRVFFLARCDRLRAMGMLALDKFYSFVPLLLGGGWGIIALLSYLFKYQLFITIPLGFLGMLLSIILILVCLHPDWIRSFVYQVSVLFPHREKIKPFLQSLDFFKKTDAVALLLLSLLLYGVYIFQFCLFALSFQKIPLTTALTATSSTILAKTLLPISFADLGIREGASVFFFMKFNVERLTAIGSSLVLFLCNVLMPSLFGLVFLPKLSLRRQPKE
ncbi:flippase-like domain-containing protein [bacterium]|nr:flippase-like domain-containing protein [bacterium]